MASEIFLRHTSGVNLYMLIWKGTQIWNGTTFVAPGVLTRPALAVVLTEVTWSGEDSRYVGDIPAGCKGFGALRVEVYIRGGAQPAASDVVFSDPLDFVYIDGKTQIECDAITAAGTAGKLSDADQDNTTIYGLDGTTQRIVATNDTLGNRSAVSYP